MSFICVHVCGQSELGRLDPLLLLLDRYVLILSLMNIYMHNILSSIGCCVVIDLMYGDLFSFLSLWWSNDHWVSVCMYELIKKREWRGNYRMDDRQHDVMTFFLFFFYKARIRKEKNQVNMTWKIIMRKQVINSSEKFFFYRKLFKTHQSSLKMKRFSIQLIARFFFYEN